MGIGAGFSAPLSMREMSSSADMMSSTAVSEASMELASSAKAVDLARSISVEV
ncbi:hypothetical protein D3C87_2206450 [compost metagenome]